VDEGRRRREETTVQIRKNKKDSRMAKRRQMPTGGLDSGSMPTPAGMAAANMLMSAGDNTYANLASQQAAAAAGGANGNVNRAMAQSKLEQLPAMVQGVMGNDPAVQTECTTQFRRLLSIEKNPPIQQVIEAGVVPRFVEFLQRDDNPAWVRTLIVFDCVLEPTTTFVLTPQLQLHLFF
jgi:importin subunit alpha-1